MLGRQSLRRLSLLHSNRALASAASNAAPPGTSEQTGSSASADSSGHQRAAQGVRRPPASSEQQQVPHAGVPKDTEGPNVKFESSSKIGWVIPVLGIPGLVAWYLYDQGFIQQEHDTYIQSLHDGIRERRQKLASNRSALKAAPEQHQQQQQLQQQQLQQEAASGFSRANASAGDRGNEPPPGNGGDEGKGAAAGAAAGPAGEEGRKSRREDSGAGIMSAVGSMEGQEQADAGGMAKDVQAAANHARAEREATASAAAAAAEQQQREQQQQQQQREQAALEQQRLQEQEQLRQQQVEREEEEQRRQQQEQEQRAREQEGLQGLQAGMDAVAAKHAAVHGYEYQPARAKSVDAVLPAVPKGRMGVEVDLSPAGLVQFAIERRQKQAGAGAGEDWENFKARHSQAAADAELFARAAQQIASWHDAEMAQVQGIADRNAARVDEVVEKAKANTESFKKLLRQHREMATELRDLEVHQAERRVVLAARKALEAERKARAEALDAVRHQLGALACAHDVRASQQSASRLSHAITLAVMDASAALDSGASLEPHLRALLSACALVSTRRGTSQAMVAQSNADSDATHAAAAATVDSTLERVDKQALGQDANDAGTEAQPQRALQGTIATAEGVGAVEEVVAAALGSMPPAAAKQGLATTQQLSARLQSLHPVVSQLALLPIAAQAQHVGSGAPASGEPGDERELPPCPGLVGGGGMLAHAVARLAAWLKVDETKAVQALGPRAALSQGSVEAALTVAKAQLAEGKLVAAADTLTAATAGTEAAAAVAAWCEEARERAVADQALRMLRAHATTLAASVM